jgi:hypothetical protein
MRTLIIHPAVVRVYDDHVETEFPDERITSYFYPPVGEPSFISAARYAGYVDPLQFGRDHDVLHSLVSARLGWNGSWVVRWDARGQPDEPETQEWRDLEEHLVVRLQRYLSLGETDADFGCLAAHFGDDLGPFALSCLLVLRPWLSPSSGVETPLPAEFGSSPGH